MAIKKFPDYYKILQVDPEAAPEVIKAAYRRLSAIYHPDNSNNRNEDARMMAINEAYHTLSDTTKRSAYHRQWLEYFSPRHQYVQSMEQFRTRRGDTGFYSASDVMDDFFHALKTRNWDSAYLKLTEEDRERVSVYEFKEWREAVDQCYQMQDYKITFYKSYQNCRIEDVVYQRIAEFKVTITDMDAATAQSSTETVHKYVAYDGVSWKVCLGVLSVKQATLKFKLLADRKKNYDPMMLYKSAVGRQDALTGLLSRNGFMEEAEREAYRSTRYGNRFSLLVLQIKPFMPEKEAACICNLANVVKSSIRKSDLAGCLDSNQIICLLTETTKENAVLAGRKLLKIAETRQHERMLDKYQIRVGIVEFSEFRSLEEGVFAACSAAKAAESNIWVNASN